MGVTKRVRVKQEEILSQAKAIHQNYISMVKGNIEKYGIDVVAQSYMTLHGPKGPYWLRQAMERVLDFAEKMQIKQVPTTLSGDSENPIQLQVYIPEVNGK